MKYLKFAAPLLLLTACSQPDAPKAESAPLAESTTATAPVSPATAAAPPENATLVATPYGAGKSEVYRFEKEQVLKARLVSPQAGTVAALGVRVGNYRGKSDGSIAMKVCQGGACEEVVSPLLGSRDNDYLVFNLQNPLAVAAKEALEIELRRGSDATYPVAIWTYPTREGQKSLVTAGGEQLGRVAKFGIYLK